MPKLLVLTFSAALRLAFGEVCPAGTSGASCAAAAAVASEADGAAEFLQVAAARRPKDASLLAASAEQLPRWYESGINLTMPLNLQEAWTGVWICPNTVVNGAKIIRVDENNSVLFHSSCTDDWEAHMEGDNVVLDKPSDVAGFVCNITDGFIFCSNGDYCSKANTTIDSLRAADNHGKYLGHWRSAEWEADPGFHISISKAGEFFFENKVRNETGFLYLTKEGLWEADLCQNGFLERAGMRMQLDNSGRHLRASYYYPGWLDWSPLAPQLRADQKHAFPWTLVAIPIMVLLFGVPASFFFLSFEGKAGPPPAAKGSKSFKGEEIAQEEADGDSEAAANDAKATAKAS